MLGQDCVLVRSTPRGFCAIERVDAASLQKCLLGTDCDPDWLFQQCERIADALNRGEVALAQIFGLRIPTSDLDDRQLSRIAPVGFVKAGFNPDEPRVPKGDSHGGQWTDGSGANAEPSSLLTDAAYQGIYHDIVVAQIAAQWRANGAKVITEVDLVARDGARARADIVAVEAVGQPLLLVEVKTGNAPRYTPRQTNVYPMAQIGDHVFSPNAKIATLGFLPGQWLPPMEFFTIYKRDEKSDYQWMNHLKPMLP
jgi:hypothetical protein